VVLAIVVAAVLFTGVLWQGRHQEGSGETAPGHDLCGTGSPMASPA
jgi:hypothetical protein